MKKIKKNKKKEIILFLTFNFVSLIIFFLGVFFYYELRSVPDLHEENQMTMLPPVFKNILGATLIPNVAQKIQIKIPIFMYHYVEYVSNDPGRQNLNIPPNILTSQIETLKNAGYTFITLDDLNAALDGKIKLPPKVAILTFDDGYMDFYTDVFPILKKEEVKAVAYIVPDFLDRPNYMFTYQLKEVAKSQLVEIGAHTMDHYALAGMSSQSVIYQVAQSRKVLQDLLNLPINSFAYPYGSFDLKAMQVVQDIGFTNAVSVIPGIIQNTDNRYFLSRLRPGYRSGQTLLKYLQQSGFQPW